MRPPPPDAAADPVRVAAPGVCDPDSLSRTRFSVCAGPSETDAVAPATQRKGIGGVPCPAQDEAVGVQKAVDLTGTGASMQEAVSEALDRARLTLDSLDSFEITRVAGDLGGAAPIYRVELRIWFTLLERMHG
jgi:flavin-binding protein dodecin